MNGDRFLLDTNILLYISGGKVSIDNLPEGQFYISFVTELEVLSYPSITPDEEKYFRGLFSEFSIIDITKEIKQHTIEFRKKYNFKLPDAIIAATVFTFGSILITNDKVFSQVKEIKIKSININTA
ncbi:MAG: type II toxin-antitoxin system VapC family toxin [Nitrospinota bacterium]